MKSMVNEKAGIGGGLALITFGLIITPFIIGAQFFTIFLPLFNNGTWDLITTPGNQLYHELWGPVLTFEMVGNLFFILFSLLLLVLLFRYSKMFPKLAITYLLLNLVFVATDQYLATLLPIPSSGETDSELIKSIAGAAIWVPYLLTSQRVKNTFYEEVDYHDENNNSSNNSDFDDDLVEFGVAAE